MMKINVGVVGVGNLGTAVINQLENHKIFNLVGVFSRRYLEGTIPFDKILTFKDKIDILFLCAGSQNDLEDHASTFIEHFNIIDCYDNHSRLKSHIKTIDEIAKENKKIALCSFGWDPGLFSLMRGLFSSLGYSPYSVWGKGTSQGHTQAIKQIDGVLDAIQFTIPNKYMIEKIKSGEDVEKNNLHSRECFVVCDPQDEERIEYEIINMPDYFKGYRTTVNFVTHEQLKQIKSFSHKGEILTKNDVMNFSLNLRSNPDFTASVMINYAKSLIKLKQEEKFGAHTIFDIPMSYIMEDDEFTLL